MLSFKASRRANFNVNLTHISYLQSAYKLRIFCNDLICYNVNFEEIYQFFTEN